MEWTSLDDRMKHPTESFLALLLDGNVPKMLGISIVEMTLSTYMSKEFQEVRGLNRIIIVVTVSRHEFLEQCLENDLSKMDVSSDFLYLDQ